MRRMQEQYLVGLHDALPLAARIAYQQVGVPHRIDRRHAPPRSISIRPARRAGANQAVRISSGSVARIR